MSSTETSITQPSPESAITPQAAAKAVENAFDTGDIDQARALLTSQFTDYLKDVQNGSPAALAEWKQLGADDATNKDDVLPSLAIDWGLNEATNNGGLTESNLKEMTENPTGDSPGDKMLSQLSAQYLSDNYSKYAGLTFDFPSAPGAQEVSSVPILAGDMEQAQENLPQSPGWKAPQEVDPPPSTLSIIANYVLG